MEAERKVKAGEKVQFVGYGFEVQHLIAGTPVRGDQGIEPVGAAPTLRSIYSKPGSGWVFAFLRDNCGGSEVRADGATNNLKRALAGKLHG
jgi:hypothetical protein